MYINVHKQITQKANEDIWDVEFSHIIHIYSLFWKSIIRMWSAKCFKYTQTHIIIYTLSAYFYVNINRTLASATKILVKELRNNKFNA